MMNDKQIFGIIIATILMLTPIMIGFDTIYAEKDYNGDGILQYKTSDGTIIDEIQHHFRATQCIHMAIFDKVIDVNTNCQDFGLTSEGEKMIEHYMAKKYFNMD